MTKVLSALVLAMPLTMAAQTPASPVRDWIAEHAIRLDTPQAGHGFADMQPLKKIVGNARIVSLGEATHGTREFFQLKHRMLEFLATEMGFTIFSIEANMPEAYRLNDYVLNGKGDPAELLRGMYFWTWNTQEVLDMILWMREFNKSGKGRVQFTGFDMQTTTVAQEIARDFIGKYDPEYLATFREAAKRLDPPGAGGQKFGSATGSFPVAAAAGKKVRFSGYIKTEKVTDGYAGLWWRVDGASGVLAFANLKDRAPKGTTDWKHYELEIPVAPEATSINFGALLAGDGTAWFDDVTIELDGQRYDDRKVLRFLETANSYRGYQMHPDPEVRRGEKPSLQIRHVQATDISMGGWKEIVQHLEESRKAYVEKQASAQAIDWAIQNARVVLQCMQMRADVISRDRSMAENVKWILDHNPGAKIVLWAHNGHVNDAGPGIGLPMGASLRAMFGDQMVIFGFAFNQGSFQAIEPNKGLHDFTVAPAPADSLDAMLAATTIPVFALDLRQAPTEGPVAAWLNEPHKTHTIGAVYSEDQAANYLVNRTAPKSFDALLFIEKTTAARKNPPPDPKGYDSAANEYRDPDYAVSVKLAPGWKLTSANHWGDQETTLALASPSGAHVGLYFKVNREPQELSLAPNIEAKAKQRITAGLHNYHVRDDSIRTRTIGERQALSCIADYDADGQAMSEYLTWVGSDKALALFFARVPKAELDVLRERLDPIIETLRIP